MSSQESHDVGESFAQRLAALIPDVAELCNASTLKSNTVRAWINGTREPMLSGIKDLASALQLDSYDDLLGRPSAQDVSTSSNSSEVEVSDGNDLSMVTEAEFYRSVLEGLRQGYASSATWADVAERLARVFDFDW